MIREKCTARSTCGLNHALLSILKYIPHLWEQQQYQVERGHLQPWYLLLFSYDQGTQNLADRILMQGTQQLQL